MQVTHGLRADLRNIDFSHVNLRGADVSLVDLENAIFIQNGFYRGKGGCFQFQSKFSAKC